MESNLVHHAAENLCCDSTSLHTDKSVAVTQANYTSATCHSIIDQASPTQIAAISQNIGNKSIAIMQRIR